MAKIEQVGVANNNIKAMHKSSLIVMRELFIQAVNFRQDEHDKEVRDLKETVVHLEGKVTVLTKDYQDMNKIISEERNKTVEFKYKIDSSSQYNRSDNLKFAGILLVQSENLVKIIKDALNILEGR